MAYTLIGSPTSPYVRRLRLYLRDIPYTFQAVNIMDPLDDGRLTRVSPIKKIPVLLIDDQPLFESRVIYNYLQKALGRSTLSLPEENFVSAIDALQDQLIQLYLLKRSGHPIDGANPYFRRSDERRKAILSYLASGVVKGEFSRWDYPSMSLYALIDWALLREAMETKDLQPALQSFFADAATQPAVAATDPRRV